MENNIPEDVLAFVESVKSTIEDRVPWTTCDSKFAWSQLNPDKNYQQKDKSSITLNYVIESEHPNALSTGLKLSLKIKADRTLAFNMSGIMLTPYFQVTATGAIDWSELPALPTLIGKYMDLKTGE
jgi:hypothetical protein